MSISTAESTFRRLFSVVGFTLLLGCSTVALFFAAEKLLPTVVLREQDLGVPLPPFLATVAHSYEATGIISTVVAWAGALLCFVALLNRGPAKAVARCRVALSILAGSAACLALFLLCCGGAGFYMVSVEETRENWIYRSTLQQFAILEVAREHSDKLRESLGRAHLMKWEVVKSADEFSDPDARDRIFALLAVLAKESDRDIRKRLLATLSLFRDKMKNDYNARELPRIAAETGVPSARFPSECLEWVAQHLHQDGWEPLPLFRIVR